MKELATAAKATHAKVHYERPSEHAGEHCDNCNSLLAGGGCKTVKSPIYLNGWCIRWPGFPGKK
jgi:hypothetical protein